jgi:protein phosphatase methylesterase 1
MPHVMQTEISEEDENQANISDESPDPNQPKPVFKSPVSNVKFKWRIDLTKTEKFWKDWFKGLSNKFLAVHVPKLLLLAGVDRLDKDLMVGQMQGKFQMQVLPHCGHAVHEDSPEDVSDALSNFMIRYKFTEALDHIKPPRLSC